MKIAGNTMVLTITDNVVDGGDTNPTAGEISDPSGPAILSSSTAAAAIPTLSEWALLIFGLMLGSLVWRQRAASANPRRR